MKSKCLTHLFSDMAEEEEEVDIFVTFLFRIFFSCKWQLLQILH